MDMYPPEDQEMADYEPFRGPRLFLDSALLADWERFLPLGLFHGVTTNPLLLERAGQECSLPNLERMTRRAVDLGAREIQLQTWGRSVEDMIHHGSQLALLSGMGVDVCVKVPATETGWRVAEGLTQSGVFVTMTAVYNPGQVLAAAGFQAAYAAPYLGRLNDAGRDGLAAILTMRDVLKNTRSETRLLVASLRSAEEVINLAGLGLDTFTFGAPVAADLLKENLTEEAAADFQRAAEAMRPSPDGQVH